MECRVGCGACCIAPSISSSIPGMAAGKGVGVRCVQLDGDNRCRLWGLASRLEFCSRFTASIETCGQSRREAMALIARLERRTGE
ncbi:MAG: YkgJ family cysteine cluster protein [Pseudomonadales bacterium]|nr:YkgJ family cysteine cluster protein [Pseudomonadales bacterium]MDP7359702.1 YkgJ family cysteine cluster protein [Pseudomonadales bacterium]MDP7594265.1 YkgJ family cysteine cluster protein [Pseudomonadales bacterium]HJN50615.1 YkgJ family cysteine cluster protein [Pseudomonadales bacterium]